ncbi:PSP1 domain-containing protein [Candidatus Magnetomorum sp. HK-1]|nr:PSP1 domain-containing protein [Candidatus Magnetomorum sp. HK-1]
MTKSVGVKFKNSNKVYYFDPGETLYSNGEQVIVETERGPGFGTIVQEGKYRDELLKDIELKKVCRSATTEDIEQSERAINIEKEAMAFCLKCIDELNLEMNLFQVESTFEISKLTFYFTADGRVDFRELVKMLVREYRTKIEMRQVGVRNQARMWGGIGRCGREICCATFLSKFDPVSIRMAKEQNLSLNPTKISGLCGRLMCCLTYEFETYRTIRKFFPRINTVVETKNGPAKVIRHNLIKDMVTVKYHGGTEMDVPLGTIKFDSHHCVSDSDLDYERED